jgi:hypothetical protein
MIAVLTGALDLTRMQPLELAHSVPLTDAARDR